MTTPAPQHHDVIVVGARCAGAATALLLARAGHDVAVFEKSPLPSDTVSTHSLVRGGVVQLARWGLLDELLATGAPPIRVVSFFRYDPAAPAPVRLPVKAKAGVDLMLAPRRRVLDQVLADAAVGAGAVIHDRTAVRGVDRDRGGRVTGVATIGPDGRTRRITARLVIGADGVRSRMAGWLGAATMQRYAPSGACLYTYIGDVDWDGFEFHLGAGTFAGVFPTHGGEACVWLMQPTALATPMLRAGRGRLDVWRQTLTDHVPGLAERIRGGTVRATLHGTVGLPNHVRRGAGPGWALVGDAGYHRDPITGHGMTDAFRDAELLADAADAALRDPSSEHEALSAYVHERDAVLAETFRITRELGTYPNPDRFVALQGELSRALDVEAYALAARDLVGARC